MSLEAPIKSQRAYAFIKERIVRQQYSPGYRLVLGRLAHELEMSVVPVREAVRRLEAENLVTYEPNVGAHVAMFDDSAYRDCMHTLGILEGAATALAAHDLGSGTLARARETNERMRRLLDRFDPRSFTELNREFHSLLFTGCPNSHLVQLVHTEWERLGHLRDSTFSFIPDRARVSVQEHDGMLDLIEARAPLDEIERAARNHRITTLTTYIEHEHPDEGRATSLL